MTSDGTALLRAICEQPEEDTPRLMFADWLDEQGDRESRTRAAFIRVQIQIARMRPEDMTCERKGTVLLSAGGATSYVPHCRCKPCSLARREYEVSKRHKCSWDGEFYRVVVAHETQQDRDDHMRPASRCFYARGFIERIQMPCALFMRDGCAAELFRALPIAGVRLMDRRLYENSAFVRDDNEGPGHIPHKLFGLWSRLPESARKWTQIDGQWMYFASQADADVTVSAMCVAHGRTLAGLTPRPVAA